VRSSVIVSAVGANALGSGDCVHPAVISQSSDAKLSDSLSLFESTAGSSDQLRRAGESRQLRCVGVLDRDLVGIAVWHGGSVRQPGLVEDRLRLRVVADDDEVRNAGAVGDG
jgi:hypothetical protein